MPLSLDSETEHYISTIAHCASLTCQRKATERSENARCSKAQAITDYHNYRNYTECLQQILPYSGPAVVVLYKHHSHDSQVPLAILLLKIKHQNEAEYIIIIHLSVTFRL